jgi:hypothetical protein
MMQLESSLGFTETSTSFTRCGLADRPFEHPEGVFPIVLMCESSSSRLSKLFLCLPPLHSAYLHESLFISDPGLAIRVA